MRPSTRAKHELREQAGGHFAADEDFDGCRLAAILDGQIAAQFVGGFLVHHAAAIVVEGTRPLPLVESEVSAHDAKEIGGRVRAFILAGQGRRDTVVSGQVVAEMDPLSVTRKRPNGGNAIETPSRCQRRSVGDRLFRQNRQDVLNLLAHCLFGIQLPKDLDHGLALIGHGVDQFVVPFEARISPCGVTVAVKMAPFAFSSNLFSFFVAPATLFTVTCSIWICSVALSGPAALTSKR